MRAIILKHLPITQTKSYCQEVIQCRCGLKMQRDDAASWREWARHLEQAIQKEV